MYLVPRILRNRGVKVQDDTKQIEEVMAKRTAKNSVFLDLFQNKSYLLKLYKTLHPEDTTATEDSLEYCIEFGMLRLVCTVVESRHRVLRNYAVIVEHMQHITE